MPPTTPGRRIATSPLTQQPPAPKRTRKPSAKAIEERKTQEALEAQSIEAGGEKLEKLIQLTTTLQETVARQSRVIEDVRAELVEIKAEQQTIQNQNVQLQEEVRSLRTQLDSYSTSPPTTRSWATVAAGGSDTSLSRATSSDNAKREPNCLRISTQARPEETDPATDVFTRYLPTNAANEHIRKAFQNINATKEVQVAGVGTTKTGYVIRFRDEQSAETARANTEWLEELGNGTELVKPRFGVVVHRTPTQGISLPGDKTECINKIMEENDFASKGYHIEDIVWLKSKDKPLGRSASLGIWLNTTEAAEWVVYNGLLFGQRYIGSIQHYQMKKKRCHRCLGFGHLAWSCKEKVRCGYCAGEHDRRKCFPGIAAKCVDCNGPHATGDRECRERITLNFRQ